MALKKVQKTIDVAEFKYNRTLIDKAAITNVLNASLKEMEIQKRQIEEAKNELDKQKKIADKQASLNRVRAEIASMRTSKDLELITPLIWKELQFLGIPFVRCGVFIMDNVEKQIHTFLSTPDGRAITAFHIPFDTPIMAEIIENWRKRTVYISHWDETKFSALADSLLENGSISTRDHYLKNIPKEGLFLHYLPFVQGMLYVGNVEQFSEEYMQVVHMVGEAFSTAFARYEDFKKLELAKLEVEKTLNELKEAQQQLIQSEKMASLGELTAGIAHEIQNPLNFVINFSDLANELVDELKAEKFLPKAERDEVVETEILEGIAKNLVKINHHGKRADSIVKGMLQHSRVSGGEKEETNINLLLDEYLRLSYHGLRAKDKSFNAEFFTELDPSLPSIHVTKQDLGRVFLNLINNAFYAVNERKKGSRTENYLPQIKITSKNLGDHIAISIRDNGNGIPSEIKDKIFQPFFTTKPTGQGTGLGLSLSYDIVKAHGGKLEVESSPGSTTFTINLKT
ncbi:ATP-binding protein [Algoriphagus sp.]|uniref:sensor histidine kinase n=1 Tax=Algoriphagus sp. TaxID=1872435 RepID=UPI00261E03A5|nr:ATP-binding protein [Algoriphagus sp.]